MQTQKLVLGISIAIVAFYLVFEHRAHLYGALPYILFGVFIFSHLFMHSGHGGHNGGKTRRRKSYGGQEGGNHGK